MSSQELKTQEYLEILRGQRQYVKAAKGYCTANKVNIVDHFLKHQTGLPLHVFNPAVLKESCEEKKKERKNKKRKEEEDFKVALRKYING